MEAKIVAIIDEYRVAINKGSEDGVLLSDVFMVYEKGKEIFDPDTKESLVVLEVLELKMKVLNIQKKLSTLESNEKEIIINRTSRKTIKKYSKNHPVSAVRQLAFLGHGSSLGDEVEEIIEEKPEEKQVSLDDRNVKKFDIARKIN